MNKKNLFLTIIFLLILIGLVFVWKTKQPTGRFLQTVELNNGCYDPDNKNTAVKGTMILNGREYTDYCVTGDGQKVDYCVGRDCFLVEYYCVHSNDVSKPIGLFAKRNCVTNSPCFKGACSDPGKVPKSYLKNPYGELE